MSYLDRPEQWDRLAERLSDPARWPLGFDTETHSQPDRTSPAHRARVQCWSIATRTERRHPRGYRHAVGVTLPREAMDHAGLRALLERPEVPLLAHNASHDYHAVRNEGINLTNLEDTLQAARVALPALWCGYGLKDLEVHVLGKQPRPKFRDVVRLDYTATGVKRTTERGCSCGAQPCRARATSDWFDDALGWHRPHTRVTWRRFTPAPRSATRQRDVAEMLPGCEGWDTWVDYALIDAVSVLELDDYLLNRPAKWGVRDYPWH